MSGLLLRAPSRLHFGLLSLAPDAPRRFGGVGLMIDEPGLEMSAHASESWSAEGPLAGRVLAFAERVSQKLTEEGTPPPPARFLVHRAPPEHVGLGVGTQLGLAVARVVAELAGRPSIPHATLAEWVGRGLRSGIGLHGSVHGGMIVDGGRAGSQGIPALLSHLPFPEDWSVLVVIPRNRPGLHGFDEIKAFDRLPPVPESVTDRLCRIVLLGLLPAVIERDLIVFGEALTELQSHVGRAFEPAQGGAYALEESQKLAATLREEDVHGIGQSSWGPAIYGFSQAPGEQRARLILKIKDLIGPDGFAIWTKANQPGATLRQMQIEGTMGVPLEGS